MRLSQPDLFNHPDAVLKLAAPSNQLNPAHWPPKLEEVNQGWRQLISDFWSDPAGQALDQKIRAGLTAGRVFFPQTPFRALSLTAFEKVQVVILGQDPYHGPDQAEGLAFSVGPGQKIPPSLRNVFKEIQRDLGVPMPPGSNAGSLVRWSAQGVLLLNTALTVEQSLPASHSNWGWEVLTDKIIKTLATHLEPKAFLLWGAHAQSKSSLIEACSTHARHLVLKANHPSPLSALRPPLPFIGCGHFGQVNRWLQAQHKKPIQW
jgi:uracil-DNA glycosylase